MSDILCTASVVSFYIILTTENKTQKYKPCRERYESMDNINTTIEDESCSYALCAA
jgi:hypothetical protein